MFNAHFSTGEKQSKASQFGAFPGGSDGKESELETQLETQVRSLALEDPLAKGMVAHSSILACKIPRTEEPGGLQSMGLQSRTRLSDGHFHVGHLHFFFLQKMCL